MSMTSERIEEIKRDAQEEAETIYRNCSANITNIELLELLAALEESQKQQEIVWNSLTKSRETLKSKRHVLKDEIHRLQTQLLQANEKIAALDIKLEESEQKLAIEEERKEGYWAERHAEAQQTIARQQSALEVFADKYAWFVTKSGGIEWIGNVDPKDIALDALKGNKEGSNKA